MVTYKNIQIKKKGGGLRTQRVMVLASGKYKFVKNLTKSKSSSSKGKTTKTKTKKRVYKMTKKKRRRGGKSITRTAFKFVRLGALAAPAIFEAFGTDTPQGKMKTIIRKYTGY
ncbi:hypothetical protein KAR91_58565, partial [Candidatus Pacearchaeota archaeon]|nr:hypothetical protein [Candidatus Pacearchaeota archaeon]